MSSPSFSFRKEIICVAVLKTEAPREARVLHTRADVHALRRVELMLSDEGNREAGQRLPAPADRRTSTVRAVLHFHGNVEQLLHPREASVGLQRREASLAD